MYIVNICRTIFWEHREKEEEEFHCKNKSTSNNKNILYYKPYLALARHS